MKETPQNSVRWFLAKLFFALVSESTRSAIHPLLTSHFAATHPPNDPPPPWFVLPLPKPRAEFPFSYRHQLAELPSPRKSDAVGGPVVPIGAVPLTPAAAAAAAAELPCSLHDGNRPERDAFCLCVFEHLCRLVGLGFAHTRGGQDCKYSSSYGCFTGRYVPCPRRETHYSRCMVRNFEV